MVGEWRVVYILAGSFPLKSRGRAFYPASVPMHIATCGNVGMACGVCSMCSGIEYRVCVVHTVEWQRAWPGTKAMEFEGIRQESKHEKQAHATES